ncbi:hypothetical protein B0H10DRAFT_1804468, partial [Mycena sp. CBHHK59/15]
LGIREHFNIPKFHAIQHYVDAIRALGSANGYNTESPEHLHIDFAKKAYRASNHRDYVEQMALWLQRQEAVALCASYLAWLDQKLSQPAVAVASPSTAVSAVAYTIAKRPATLNVSVAHLQTTHGAVDIIPALTRFLKLNFKSSPIIPGQFDRFDLYNQVSLHVPPNRYLSDQSRTSRIHAIPAVPAKDRSRGTPASFDTALVIEDPSQYVPSSGIQGHLYIYYVCHFILTDMYLGLRPAQIRVIFKLPPQFGSYPHPLAYIEWFTALNRPDPVTGMYTTHRSTRQHRCNAAVVSVEHIVRSCHLMAKCGTEIDRKWTSINILDTAPMFYVNPYILVDTFTRDRFT